MALPWPSFQTGHHALSGESRLRQGADLLQHLLWNDRPAARPGCHGDGELVFPTDDAGDFWAACSSSVSSDEPSH